jgi:hypothetical protein
MVDVTFTFVLFLGGALVGLVTGLVRRHGIGRTALDMIVGTLTGLAGTSLWIELVARAMPAYTTGNAPLSASTLMLLSDILYFSPVIGALAGVALFGLLNRLVVGPRSTEPWGHMIGDALTIAGYVYGAIALALSLALIGIAIGYERTDVLDAWVMTKDILIGGCVVLAGTLLARFADDKQKPSGPGEDGGPA